jgi:hypothetical protein
MQAYQSSGENFKRGYVVSDVLIEILLRYRTVPCQQRISDRCTVIYVNEIAASLRIEIGEPHRDKHIFRCL